MATENSEFDFGDLIDPDTVDGSIDGFEFGDEFDLGEIAGLSKPNPFDRLDPVFMGTLLFIPNADQLKSWCDGLIRSAVAVAFHDALVEAGCLKESAGFASSSSYENFFNFMEMAERFAFYQKEGEAPAFFIYAGLAWIVSKVPPLDQDLAPHKVVTILEIDEEHCRALRLNEPWSVRVLIGNGTTFFEKHIEPSVPVSTSTDDEQFPEIDGLEVEDELLIETIGQSFQFANGKGLYLGELSYKGGVVTYSPRCSPADTFPDQISTEFQQLQRTADARLSSRRLSDVRHVLDDVCRHQGFASHDDFEKFAVACLVRLPVEEDRYHGFRPTQGLRLAVLRSLWDFKNGKKLESRAYIHRHVQIVDVEALKMEVLMLLSRHLHNAKKNEETAEGNAQ
jgi:hypothetical protein